MAKCLYCNNELEKVNSNNTCVDCEKKINEYKKKNKVNVFKQIWIDLVDIFKHPKRMIPTIVLLIIWTVMPLIFAFVESANIPIIRWICAITYANGGMFGGIFGTIGGIFGKIVFALCVNTLVTSIILKKNPFRSLKKGMDGAFKCGIEGVSPFIIACGVGMILYLLFNVTSDLMNSSIALILVVFLFMAIGNSSNCVFVFLYYLLRKISNNKAPKRVTISRIILGLSAGLGLSFPLTFIQKPLLMVIIGFSLIVVGTIFVLFSKKFFNTKKVACILLFIVIVTILQGSTFVVYAEETSGYWEFDEILYSTKMVQDSPDASATLSYENGMFTANIVKDKELGVCNCYDDPEDLPVDDIYPIHTGEWHYCEDESMTYTVNLNGLNDRYLAYDEANLNVTMTRTFNSEHFCFDLLSSTVTFYRAMFYLGDADREISESELLDGSLALTDYPDGQPFMVSNFPESQIRHKASETPIVTGTLTHMMYDGYYPSALGGMEKLQNGEPLYLCAKISCRSANIKCEAVVLYKYLWYSPEIIVPTGPDEPVEPVEPVEPIEPVEPVEPIEPVEPVEPTNPVSGPGEDTGMDSSETVLVIAGVITTVIGGFAGAGAANVLGGLGSTGNTLGEGIVFEEDIPDLGPDITVDLDGDYNVTDPVTGEKRIYVSNRDGTYTNPLTDATYTVDQLVSSVASRRENYELLRKDHEVSLENINDQREDAKELSSYELERNERIKNYETDKSHDEYKEELFNKYGVTDGDASKVKKEILENRQEELIKQQEYAKEDGFNDQVVVALEETKKITDIAVNVYSKVDTNTGAVLKTAYTVGTNVGANIGEVVAGNKSVAGGVASAITDTTVDLIKDSTNSAAGKAVTYTTGNALKSGVDAYTRGKSTHEVVKATVEGSANGLVEATVDIGMDNINDVLPEGNGELTEVGKTLIGDTIKTSTPGVMIPKKNKK